MLLEMCPSDGYVLLWMCLLAAILFTSTLTGSIADSGAINLTQWRLSDIAKVGDDPFGNLVKYGYALFTDTANKIGPSVELGPDLQMTAWARKLVAGEASRRIRHASHQR
jgi:hypothetical protein